MTSRCDRLCPEPLSTSFAEKRRASQVGTDRWTDITSILVTGSVVTTLSTVGAVTIEGEVVGTERREFRVAELLGGGSARAVAPSR